MMQIGLIGIGAGAAAALLFASVASGSLLSMLLFYLAPLPILIAALGWSHWAALIARRCGALALAAVFGSIFFLAFLAGIGLPAWWLGYLALLARPAGGAVTAQAPPSARMVSARPSGVLGRRPRRAVVSPPCSISASTPRASAISCAQSVERALSHRDRPIGRDRRNARTGWSTFWSRLFRRRPRCSPRSPTWSISGSPAVS